MNFRIASSIAALSLVTTFAGCVAPGPDAVKDAKQVNTAVKPPVSKDASAFLVEMVDARLMDIQEGKLAAERGSRPELRQYGLLMLKDQPELLKKLNTLAAASAVAVPTQIGAEKRAHLMDLMATENGEKLDKALISSLRIDHDRDVGEFTKATRFGDAEISEFAAKNLPLIQSHLDGIKQIDKNY